MPQIYHEYTAQMSSKGWKKRAKTFSGDVCCAILKFINQSSIFWACPLMAEISVWYPTKKDFLIEILYVGLGGWWNEYGGISTGKLFVVDNHNHLWQLQ